VLGVNTDSLASHRKFKEKNRLPYRLLFDEEHRLADAFGIWKPKSIFGHEFLGIERTTVIVDRDGRIARIFPKVKIPGHVEEVVRTLRQLN
jgi:thioredoxin-dependent peroxiredoxin